MKRNLFKKSTLAAAVAIAALGLGAAGNAQATAIAYAYNELLNFSITTTAGYTVVSGTRNTTTDATYSGYPGASFQDPQSFGLASDATQSTAGPGPFPGANNFNFLAGSALGMNGGRADAMTDAGNPFDAGGVPQVQSVAEARVPTGYTATGSGTAGNTNNLSLQILVDSAGTFTFTFDELARVYASTDLFGESATASISSSFRIASSDTGQLVFNWSPIEDNTGCGSNSNIPAVCDSGILSYTGLTATSGVLQPGLYNISLNASSDTTATSVPEPASMALLGLGLVGLAATRRRFVRV